MTAVEPSFSVHVDVTNPGQFFACCGLLELAHRLWPSAQGWFGDGIFHVATPGEAGATARTVLMDLSKAEAKPLAGSKDPKIPPIELGSPFRLRLDWWLDARGDKTALGKMFAGNKRTLGDVTRLQKALWQALKRAEDTGGVFQWSKALKGRFGVDPRAAWEALDLGFSPNTQGMRVQTFFAVELMGAIGLQASPPRNSQRAYFYRSWSLPLPACVARAVACESVPVVRGSGYQFYLTRRGRYKGFSVATSTGEST